MKINKRTALITICLLLIVLLMPACASKSNIDEDFVRGNESTGETEPSGTNLGEESRAESGTDSVSSIEPEKVITTIHLSLETTEFDSTIADLNNVINKNKGYIENSHISSRNRAGSKVFKHADYTIRIPKNNVDAFTGGVNSIGNIISQDTSKEDITKQYHDTESRLNLLKTKEERMTVLLEKAEKIEDIITIENQLSEIIHQKENLTKSVLDMDDKIAYSIVHMHISEVEKLRSDVTTKTTFATKISNAFKDSLYAFKVFTEGFVIVFIYVLPYLLIGGLIAFAIIKFIKFLRKRRSS